MLVNSELKCVIFSMPSPIPEYRIQLSNTNFFQYDIQEVRSPFVKNLSANVQDISTHFIDSRNCYSVELSSDALPKHFNNHALFVKRIIIIQNITFHRPQIYPHLSHPKFLEELEANDNQASENHQEILKRFERFEDSFTEISIAATATKCNLELIAERQPVIESKLDDMKKQTETIFSKLASLDNRVVTMEGHTAVPRRNLTAMLQQSKLIIAEMKKLHQAQRRQFRLTQVSNTARSEAEEKLLATISELAPLFHLGNNDDEGGSVISALSTAASSPLIPYPSFEEFYDGVSLVAYQPGVLEHLSKEILGTVCCSTLIVLPFWLVLNFVGLGRDVMNASLEWIVITAFFLIFASWVVHFKGL